jgi:hypothetical protein
LQVAGVTAEEAISTDTFFDEVIATSLYSKPSLPRATLPPISHAPKTEAIDRSAYEKKKKKGPVRRKQISPVAASSK